MNRIVVVFSLLVLFAACNTKDKKAQIVGKWQAVDMDNPQLMLMMDEQRAFLDTFGINNTEQQNIDVYGFSNIDSARKVLQEEMDEYMKMQDHAIQNTHFEFRKDGMLIMDFSGQVDSTQWDLDEQNMIVLKVLEGEEEPVNLEVLSVSDTLLKLALKEQGMSSVVIFKPEDK